MAGESKERKDTSFMEFLQLCGGLGWGSHAKTRTSWVEFPAGIIEEEPGLSYITQMWSRRGNGVMGIKAINSHAQNGVRPLCTIMTLFL